jgi:DNA-binding MarR family transcriptional regulator
MELTTKQGVAFLTAALSYVREHLDSEAQVQKIMALLIVHAKPGIKQPDIADMVGNIAQSSISRSLMDMSHLTQARATGPALIIQRPDPEFRRRNVVETTDRGNTFIENMVKAGIAAANKVKG